ncbi:DUF2252 family protein [Pseudoduganella sp. UC29_106]|uniref:DUF2252 family protein n=1 Tax=Pseudoduganella sp. UC29_106 TaxID=3374553 RepID=UPI00375647AC
MCTWKISVHTECGNRLSYFDINDFGEALLAPASWELSRFLVSVLVAVDALMVRPAEAIALCHGFLDAYVDNLTEGKPRWVERATAEGIVRDLLRDLRLRERPRFPQSPYRNERRDWASCACMASRRCQSMTWSATR